MSSEGTTGRRVVSLAVLTGSSLLIFVTIYLVLSSNSNSKSFSHFSSQAVLKSLRLASVAVQVQGDSNTSQYTESRQMELKQLYKGEGRRVTEATSARADFGQPPKRRPPDFIVIGVRKCGTRALLSMISVHPQVVSAKPEIHYFDRDSNYKRGLKWYVSQMPRSQDGQLTGEKSPSYFVTPGVPARIKDFSRSVGKEVKLLVIVRNPVDRVVSDYAQRLDNQEISLSQMKHIRQDFRNLVLNSRTERINKNWAAVTTSLYPSYLTKWFQVFPQRQVHIVNGDNFINRPLEEIKKVSSFLHLNEFDWDSHLYYNKTRGFYCFKAADSGDPFCLGSSKGRQHPQVEGALLKKLREFYRPYNRKFMAMTGLDVKWPS